MNVMKTDLVRQLRENYGYTKKAATNLVDDFMRVIMDNLEQGNTVTLTNFGIFDILERKARACPNPQTGERVEVPAHWIPRFYPSKRMRLAVKVWEDNEKRGLN